jgi:pyruvate dehydrogenase E1 component beta subunit
MTTVMASVAATGWLFTVEENPRLCGWGAEVASIVAEEGIDHLSGPIVRITTPHIPLPAAENLERLAIPTPSRVADTIRRALR